MVFGTKPPIGIIVHAISALLQNFDRISKTKIYFFQFCLHLEMCGPGSSCIILCLTRLRKKKVASLLPHMLVHVKWTIPGGLIGFPNCPTNIHKWVVFTNVICFDVCNVLVPTCPYIYYNDTSKSGAFQSAVQIQFWKRAATPKNYLMEILFLHRIIRWLDFVQQQLNCFSGMRGQLRTNYICIIKIWNV